MFGFALVFRFVSLSVSFCTLRISSFSLLVSLVVRSLSWFHLSDPITRKERSVSSLGRWASLSSKRKRSLEESTRFRGWTVCSFSRARMIVCYQMQVVYRVEAFLRSCSLSTSVPVGLPTLLHNESNVGENRSRSRALLRPIETRRSSKSERSETSR